MGRPNGAPLANTPDERTSRLTDLGRRQADALADMLDGTEFALRPVQSVDSCLGDHGAGRGTPLAQWPPTTCWSGTTARTRGGGPRISGRRFPTGSVWTHPIVDGESLEEIGARADRAIVRATSAEGPVAMFAHGHLLRILAARWMGLPAVHGRSFRLDTATVSALGWEREHRVVQRWNEACHLHSMDPVL